jgi:hypothetical protein
VLLIEAKKSGRRRKGADKPAGLRRALRAAIVPLAVREGLEGWRGEHDESN